MSSLLDDCVVTLSVVVEGCCEVVKLLVVESGMVVVVVAVSSVGATLGCMIDGELDTSVAVGGDVVVMDAGGKDVGVIDGVGLMMIRTELGSGTFSLGSKEEGSAVMMDGMDSDDCTEPVETMIC